MTTLDQAYTKFIEISSSVSVNIDAIITEEDAKIQIITRILTECLGWDFSDLAAERKHQNGFSDYLITRDGRNALIIEAKRIGRVDISVTDTAVQRNLKLNGPGLIKANEGISQAATYAQPNGVPVAVLTDGNAWIVFKPIVSGESYLEKQAFVFPSLNAVAAKFSLFYELLGKEPFSTKVFSQLFDELHNIRTLLSTPLVAPIDSTEIFRQQKTKLAFDLEPVFDRFFSRLSGEEDPELLIECFVETRESRIADHSLEKMTARVLGNIALQSTDLDKELSEYLSNAVELDTGESIFLVGPTGAGKSTFIDRFFKKTLERETRSKCVPVRLNFLEASGILEPTLKWITESLIHDFESSLYEGGNPTWNELRGLYYTEYERQRKGTKAKLYERDKAAFQEEFGNYMNEKVESDREGYLKRLLADIVHNRRKLPVIICDNTDEFTPQVKEAIFQYIQSLKIHAKHCILIFPITDKSAWSFTKTDIYSIYQSKSFFLPTPPPREVFRKRIEYLKEKIPSKNENFGGKKYLTDNNITVSISNLMSFADVVEDAFVNDEYSAKTIGEISNYNIRRTLRLARRVITSPLFQIDDLILAFASGSATYNRQSKFLTALLKGDYNYYNKSDADAAEIVPIFQVDRKFNQSPLMQLRILTLLQSAHNGATNVEQRHLSYASISDYFQAIGGSETAIDSAVLSLINNNLVEPFDPSERGLTPLQRLAINFAGSIHLKLATNNPIFFEQMALTTEISNSDTASMISSTNKSSLSPEVKSAAIRTLFCQHLIDQDELEINIPSTGSPYQPQRDLTDHIRGFATAEDDKKNNIKDSSNINESGLIYEGVIGTIDFYDAQKGFGFIDLEIGERCYIGSEALKRSALDSINDGDDILCDIGPSPRGPLVVQIHDIQSRPEEITLVECVIVRLKPDRQFGFASVFGRNDDAFFHFSLLPSDILEDIKIGLRFEAEVRVNSKTGLQQVRRIQNVFPLDLIDQPFYDPS